MNELDFFSRDYKPIPVSSLLEDSCPSFDIYIKLNDKFVLFVTKNSIISIATLEKIEKNGIEVLYINRYDEALYEKYTADQMDAYSKDNPIILEKKSKMLYSSASNVMNRLFSENITKESIGDAKQAAEGLLEQITSDKKAFLSLMKVSSHDYYTYTHSINVCMYAISLGQQLGLNKEEMRLLAEGALLHDIGKSEIDSSIINKNGKLDEAEFAAMKNHPAFGAEILERNGEKNEIIRDIVRHHHEKLDGKGYPDGKDASTLGKFAQIVAIADIFDALTTRRSYKEPLSSFEAFSLMRSKMKDELNGEMLLQFIKRFKE